MVDGGKKPVDEWPELAIMSIWFLNTPVFDFWKDPCEDIYTLEDGVEIKWT